MCVCLSVPIVPKVRTDTRTPRYAPRLLKIVFVRMLKRGKKPNPAVFLTGSLAE